MKKISLVTLIAFAVVFQFCSSTKQTTTTTTTQKVEEVTAKKVVKLTYETDVQHIIAGYCSPCHMPEKGGRKLPLDNYKAVMKNIDNIIDRIKLSPDQRGFMPLRSAKLSDSTIMVIEKWKKDGLLDK